MRMMEHRDGTGGSSPVDDDPRPRLAYDRTHLANERTFASWIRTGLSVCAVAIGIAHFSPAGEQGSARVMVLGGILLAIGIGLIAFGGWRYAQVNRELATASAPTLPAAPWVIYALAALLCLALLAVLVAL
jgi:putative membrane protein